MWSPLKKVDMKGKKTKNHPTRNEVTSSQNFKDLKDIILKRPVQTIVQSKTINTPLKARAGTTDVKLFNSKSSTNHKVKKATCDMDQSSLLNLVLTDTKVMPPPPLNPGRMLINASADQRGSINKTVVNPMSIPVSKQGRRRTMFIVENQSDRRDSISRGQIKNTAASRTRQLRPMTNSRTAASPLGIQDRHQIPQNEITSSYFDLHPLKKQKIHKGVTDNYTLSAFNHNSSHSLSKPLKIKPKQITYAHGKTDKSFEPK